MATSATATRSRTISSSGKPEMKNGYVHLSDRPGFGVEVELGRRQEISRLPEAQAG